ncbi:hypothetical protein [Cohnella laeviribosi]|uniref:hypothetical protein n=1 Tax=Cohnella laeviribosi TaxID=380174 RepID=UPI003D1F8B31
MKCQIIFTFYRCFGRSVSGSCRRGSSGWLFLRSSISKFFGPAEMGLLQGLRYIVGNRLLLVLISGFLFFGIVNGVFAVLPIFAMKYKLSPDQYVVHSSLITVFLGIGFLIGSILGPHLIRRFTRAPILISGLFISSLLVGGLGWAGRIEV